MSREYFESYTNAQLTELIRSAMREGCIKPCHVYDAVDILLDRLADKPLRNCDVGSAEEQDERFTEFCNSFDGCVGCPFKHQKGVSCSFLWAQMPYKEGGVE